MVMLKGHLSLGYPYKASLMSCRGKWGVKYLTRITGGQYQGGKERKGVANLESLPPREEPTYFGAHRPCTAQVCTHITVALCMHCTREHGTETELQPVPARTVSMKAKR